MACTDLFLGDSHLSLRNREVFKYFQPCEDATTMRTLSEDLAAKSAIFSSCSSLIAGSDPVLICFANLTARMLNAKRCMVTMVGNGASYVVAEATQSLSITPPHTCNPGDELFFGGMASVPRVGTMCELTVSMMPPDAEQDEGDGFLLEIADLALHPQFADAPFVHSWPSLRFYAGVPLRSRNGVSVGTICIMDESPRMQGLTKDQKMTLTKMGDIVMDYFETKQGDRDMKKGKVMEMGLSQFIAEGVLSGEAAEMTERRNGQLWSEGILHERRVKEMERKRKVEEKRKSYQERRFVEMMRKKNVNCGIASSSGQNLGCMEASPPIQPLRYSPEQRPSQPSSLESPPPLSRQLSYPFGFPSGDISPNVETHGDQSLVQPPRPATHNLSSTKMPRLKSNSLFSPPPSLNFHDPEKGSNKISDCSSEAEALATSPRRLSKYEQTSSFEPFFRATFSRAAELIHNSIEANVVFLDGDLEGVFASGQCDRKHNCGFAHVSTDKESEAATRAERHKSCRRRTGVLGYVTSGGSSNSRSDSGFSSCSVELLGFDVAELDETVLNKLVEQNPRGRIVAHEFAPLPDDPEAETDAVLQRFLPGYKSVIIMPLYDHSQKLFAVCFAWTCSPTKTFCGDIEGSFVNAVSNSIMAEATRLSILNADRAKGEFISSISHELRSPLHGILASAEFLSESELDLYQRSFVDTIISCGTTLLDTINHVLDFQKLNSLQNTTMIKPCTETSDGKKNNLAETQSHLVDTDLASLVEDVTEGVCLGFEFKGISTPAIGEGSTESTRGRVSGKRGSIAVIVDIEPQPGAWVFRAHPAALKRIINNIVSNSLKYTDSGWVRIRLSAQDIPNDQYGNKRGMVKISVSDSGKGISREFLKTRLFTPFSQENPLTAGAGLGMSIVRQIVDIMDGKIDVRSQVGRGTKVTVHVPLIHKVVPFQLHLDPMHAHDPSVLDVRNRTWGKRMKISLMGFNTFGDIKCPKFHGANLLRASVERYGEYYFDMEVLDGDDAKAKDGPPPDIILINENLDNEDEVGSLSNRGGRVATNLEVKWPNIPVILLCNRPPLDVATPSSRILTFVRKPCGPKKFARAIAFCLDGLDEKKKGYFELPHGTSTDSSAGVRYGSSSSSIGGDSYCGSTRSPTAVVSTLVTPVTPPSNPMEDMFSNSLHSKPSVGKSTMSLLGWNPTDFVQANIEKFTLSEPKPMPPTPPADMRASAATVRKPTVLAVEDNKINLMLLSTYLRKHGYPFETAQDGLEALQMVRQHPDLYDVILMDLQMPVMSGIESTREIRYHEQQRLQERGYEGKEDKDPIRRSFIIALTGLAALSDQKEAFEAGIDSFMVKPVNFKDLEKTLSTLAKAE